ncbi:tyrosine-type recombinase/integrase [Sulfuritalea sp.]|uniref:tyrosine-type recombinase/integrase n=1 Tax=Sulfuritalea sp. TaxID=2480090 RepID=UPI00286E1341|nr:tyrosine-type recombinase/integrase [Sulfuritalea sp.]
MGRLTDIDLRNWIRSGKPTAKADGEGLTFTLSAKGTAAWTLRYSHGGKAKELTLGRYPDMSLAKAREIASAKRVEIQQGVDVAAQKRQADQAAAQAWTFRRLAEDYFDKGAKKLAATTTKNRAQQLRDFVYPKIGHIAAADVTPADIVGIVEATAGRSLHVARLVMVGIRMVFAHGIARHVVTTNPCAHIRSEAIIGGAPDQRERVMLTDTEIAEVFRELPTISRPNALMVRILLATGARIGELVQAEWVHLDFERAEWTIPPEHSKTKRGFVVPLPPMVAGWFAELHSMAFESRYVMPIRARMNGKEGDLHMEPVTLNAALVTLAKKLGKKCRRFTPHDLRSTCRSHLGALGVDVLIAERCLNHSLGGLVATYDKHDYLTERRRALELWAAKLASIENGEAFNVVQLRRA